MSGLDKQTTERMREAFKVEIDDQTKRLHQAMISEALSDHVPDSVPTRRAVLKPMWWRMRVRALVTAMVIVLPVGTAIAAENTVPGDFLYSVKTASEPIRSMFDSDVAARHRVSELEHLMDHPDRVDRLSDAVTDAEEAVTDLPMNHPLRGQLSTLTDMAMDTMQSGNGQMGGTQHEGDTDGTQHNGPMQDSPSDSPMSDDQMSDMPQNDSSEFDSPADKDRSGGDKSGSNDTGQTDANTGGTSDMDSGSTSDSDMDQGDGGSADHNHDNDSSGSDGSGWPGDQWTDG
jgi:hypothetical protein